MKIIPIVLAALMMAGCATVPAPNPAPALPVTVGIVAINDFHGALEPPGQSVVTPNGSGNSLQLPAGGAAWLATAVEEVRSRYPNNLMVAAGDLTGASQLSSSLFLDEPSVGVMNRIGLEYNAVGNHEFDRGARELQRLQNGGCEQNTTRQPCAVEPAFGGAHYRYLAANVMQADGATLFPGTAIKRFGSGNRAVSVGLIGLTLKGTSSLVSPGGIAGLTFGDEAQTINAAAALLKAAGADAVVVLIHQGVKTGGTVDPNGCEETVGDLLPILGQLDSTVDVIISGHTHWAYVCRLPTRDPAHQVLLTSAGVYGKLVTDIALQIDPARHRVVGDSAHNIIVQSRAYSFSGKDIVPTDRLPRFAPDPVVAAYVGQYVDAAREFSERPAGRLAAAASKGQDDEANTGGPLGNLIADAQLAATRDAGAQIAFMNPFGIRAALDPKADGTLTFGDLYKVQPFANTLVTQTLRGAQLKALLEQDFDADGPEQVLTPSAGFRYSYDLARPVGSRIVSMELDGRPIDPQADYRITSNSFLAGGGDFYTVFTQGRDAVIGATDIDALEAWLGGAALRRAPADMRGFPARTSP